MNLAACRLLTIAKKTNEKAISLLAFLTSWRYSVRATHLHRSSPSILFLQPKGPYSDYKIFLTKTTCYSCCHYSYITYNYDRVYQCCRRC